MNNYARQTQKFFTKKIFNLEKEKQLKIPLLRCELKSTFLTSKSHWKMKKEGTGDQ